MPRQSYRSFLLLLVAPLLSLTSARWAAAADLEQAAGSLRLAPADVSFYTAMLRNREQIEAIGNSRAWAALKSLPAVQAAWKTAKEKWNEAEGPQAEILKQLEQPENKELLAFLGEMVADEVFFLGGTSFTDFADLLVQLSGSMRFGPAMMRLTGENQGINPQQTQAVVALRALAENLELLRAPDMIVGLKVADDKRFAKQLKRLEDLLKGALEADKRWQGRLKRVQIAGSSFLTLTVDGKMVDWKKVPFKDLESEDGEFDELVKKLKSLKLTVSLGMRDGYVLLGVGESTEPLAKLGTGKRLVERKELQRVKALADKKLVGIGYLSQDLRERMATSEEDIDSWVEMAEEYLPKLPVPEKVQKRIAKDLEDLGGDLKTLLPQWGAMTSASYRGHHGQEIFTYDWSKYPTLDGAKPLPLLNHLGGDPLLAVVSRQEISLTTYDLFVKWAKVAHRYVEELVVPKIGEDKAEQYEKAAKIVFPVLKKMDDATRTMLIPALADGQSAFVLDGQWSSKQWSIFAPTTEKALPLPEIAWVQGVSDPALLRKALMRYRTLANELLKELNDLYPFVPKIEIPPATAEKGKDGTLYFHPLPALLGLDARVMPNLGLAESIVVASLSKEHSQRLLAKQPLKNKEGPFANLERSLAGAMVVNWAGMVTFATPWIELGIERAYAAKENDGDDDEPKSKSKKGKKELDGILAQTRTVLEVVKCVRSIQNVKYFENGALVTHALVVVRDLPEKK